MENGAFDGISHSQMCNVIASILSLPQRANDLHELGSKPLNFIRLPVGTKEHELTVCHTFQLV